MWLKTEPSMPALVSAVAAAAVSAPLPRAKATTHVRKLKKKSSLLHYGGGCFCPGQRGRDSGGTVGVLDGAVDGSVFNHLLASAACTSLAAFNGGELQAADAKSAMIQRLASRIEVLIVANEVGPRQLANVLWAFAKMFVAVPRSGGDGACPCSALCFAGRLVLASS